MSTTGSLSSRTALVTGGARGIGAAIADALAAAGASVTVLDLAPEPAADLPYRYIGADLSTGDAPASIAERLGEEPLDILVNNAGYEVEEDSLELSLADWDRTLTVNLLAPVRLIGALRKNLTARPGAAVVNVTSIHERVPYPRHLSYSVSKAGLSMATKVLAIELAPRGIRVNAVAPGVIRTSMNEHTIAAVGEESFQRAVPTGTIGVPGDVAGAVAFLASDAARYITGTTLYVDGAYSENIVRY
ncbi:MULTISPECIES: SDR family NAD(P)-dependent oxidoreductase [Actinomadura]|uniref:SDR family NAD(P)-dependent oxidoreductase n=1 Tax=Actinomadura yumaensis TaxID=111807 RepID=A0ABW2CCG0_9ACTN|nr:SDR family oxidoreductase [Actinomadura sp. J1-007]MWK38370.1 SDR family oxidoreductase [Actinomadura sp. J1-007]